MSGKEYHSWIRVWLKTYVKQYKDGNREERLEIKKNIYKNINLTEGEKDKIFNLITTRAFEDEE